MKNEEKLPERPGIPVAGRQCRLSRRPLHQTCGVGLEANRKERKKEEEKKKKKKKKMMMMMMMMKQKQVKKRTSNSECVCV